MSRSLLVGAVASLSLSACCHTPTTPPCWQDVTGYAFSIPDTAPQGGVSIRDSLRKENADRCAGYREDQAAAKPLDVVIQSQDCNDAYTLWVLKSYCGDVAASAFCSTRCPSDPSCLESGRATLVRNCGAASFGQFLELYGYCANFRLEGTQLFPITGSRPRCP